MGRHSIRTWFALSAASALAASGLALVSTVGAGAILVRTITVVPGSGDAIGELNEGNSSQAVTVGKFFDSGKPACTYQFYDALIHWGDGTSSNGTVTCETSTVVPTVGAAALVVPTGTWDVTGSHTYKDSGTYTVSLAVSDNETGTTSGNPVNTTTATISDVGLVWEEFDVRPTDGKAVEGATVSVGSAFFDRNNSYPQAEGPTVDPGISGSINWGDGSAVQTVTVGTPPDACDCLGDAWIAGTHVYDAKTAPGSYTVTFKATDDGGQTASSTMTITVTDGNLTAGTPAKSVAAVATKASSPIVASFADAASAQAAAADFTASINWGDNSASAGTVTKTAAGAFNVSGTHTYAAAGNRTLTITVTDEEGKTLSMTAAATVGAAPPVLPLTGQAKTASAPSAPSILWLALGLALLTITGGVGAIVRRRFSR